MTKDTSDLARLLEPFLENVAEYRAAAKVIVALVAQHPNQISDEILLRVEEICDDIRSDVLRLATLVRSRPRPDATDAALITEVEDALRLVLLEMTEMGTRLYSIRSEVM